MDIINMVTALDKTLKENEVHKNGLLSVGYDIIDCEWDVLISMSSFKEWCISHNHTPIENKKFHETIPDMYSFEFSYRGGDSVRARIYAIGAKEEWEKYGLYVHK